MRTPGADNDPELGSAHSRLIGATVFHMAGRAPYVGDKVAA